MRSLPLVLMILILFLTACQTAPPEPTLEPVVITQEPSSEGDAGAYPPQAVVITPGSGEGYPAPDTGEGFSGQSAYPEPGSEEAPMISWEQAQDLILKGRVSEVFQLHNLTVFLTLDDGTRVQTVEPAIDDVFDLLEQCGDPCADIVVATE